MTLFARVDNALPYQVMIGDYAADGNLLVASRDSINPWANHNILAVNSLGDDIVVSTPAQYPPPNRLGVHMLPDQSDVNFMFVLDTGRRIAVAGEDGRLFRLNLGSGDLAQVPQL